jgi:hypothetical protein
MNNWRYVHFEEKRRDKQCGFYRRNGKYVAATVYGGSMKENNHSDYICIFMTDGTTNFPKTIPVPGVNERGFLKYPW